MGLSSLNNLMDKTLLSKSQVKYHDVYSTVFLLLYLLKDNPKYASLNDLVMTLDQDSFTNFITIFGGTTITVPTKNEVDDAFKGLMMYQLKYVEKQDGRAINSLLDINSLSRERVNNIKKMAKETRDIMKSMSAGKGLTKYDSIGAGDYIFNGYKPRGAAKESIDKKKAEDESKGKSQGPTENN